MKIFLLTYAGGSASSYNQYIKYLKYTENILIELPGHILCLDKPLIYDYQQAVYYVMNQIKNFLNKNEAYIVFGHSLGAILGFHASCLLMEEFYLEPTYIFLSGALAPDKKRTMRHEIDQMSDREFLQMLDELGGTPKEFAFSKELLDLYLPILRADFKIVESYTNMYQKRQKSQAFILNGIQDKNVVNSELNWQNYFYSDIKIIHFEGGHFFINDCLSEIFNMISDLVVSDMESVKYK